MSVSFRKILPRRICAKDVGADIFRRGLCLPSDNKMTKEEQGAVIELVKGCFA